MSLCNLIVSLNDRGICVFSCMVEWQVLNLSIRFNSTPTVISHHDHRCEICSQSQSDCIC